MRILSILAIFVVTSRPPATASFQSDNNDGYGTGIRDHC